MNPGIKIPLKKYKLLTILLNQDKEIYTNYTEGKMPHRIHFDDLTRTLHINPDLYHRPIVELEDYGFLIRGNNIFFEAGVNAGFESFICDVNIRTLNDRHMSQFQLMDFIPEEKPYKLFLVFFIDLVLSRVKNLNNLELFNDEINYTLHVAGYWKDVLFEVLKHDAIVFKVLEGNTDPQKATETAKLILSKYGSLRSINGLIQNKAV